MRVMSFESGGGGGGSGNITIQPDQGTSPTSDIFSFTSPDLDIIGNATTDTLQFGFRDNYPIPTWIAADLSSNGSAALLDNTTYYYVVVAHTIDGTTLQSAEISQTTASPDLSILLRWDLVPGASSYDIYQSLTSGVYTDCFLLNILARDAYQNWANNGHSPYPDQNNFLDDGSIGVTAGSPPTVNSSYRNRIGPTNHFNGLVVYPMQYTVDSPGGPVNTYTQSGGYTSPLSAAFFISPETELSQQGDIPIFWVGRDLAGFNSGFPSGLVCDSPEAGKSTFSFCDTARNFQNFKAANAILSEDLTAVNAYISGDVYCGGYNGTTGYALNGADGIPFLALYANDDGFSDSIYLAAGGQVHVKGISTYIETDTGYRIATFLGNPSTNFGRLGIGLTSKISTLSVQAWDVFTLSGTTSINGSTHVVGDGNCFFTSEVGQGDSLSFIGGGIGIVMSITDDNNLIVDTAVGDGSTNSIQSYRAAGSFIDSRGNLVTSIDSRTATLVMHQNALIKLGLTLKGNFTMGEGSNFIIGTTTGSKFGTSTSSKIGFYNSTPIVQPSNGVAINDVLVNLGLRGSGGTSTFTTTLQPKTGATGGGLSPIKYTSGSLQTTAEAGTREFNGNHYATNASLVRFAFGGVIFDHFADAGNSTTTETDLYSDTTIANTLNGNGDKIEAIYAGIFVSSATATREIKIYFAGSVIFDSGALSISAGSDAWEVRVTIIRESSSVIRSSVTMSTTGAAINAYANYTRLTGLTLSGTNILKITGQAAAVGAATNDIVAKLGTVYFEPAR